MKKVLRRILAFVLMLATVISTFSAVAYALPEFSDEYGEFLDKLGYYESRNTYNIKNSYGYMGRWQMGHMALIDIGFMTNSTTYSATAAKFGVYSDEDFLNSPEAQDYCIQLYDKKLVKYIEYFGDQKYIGQTMWNIKITLSGLVAAAHLVGAGGLHQMLKTGEIATDANGSKATFYLENLAGYDIAKSIGTSIVDSTLEESTPQKTESTIHFYENYSGINYMTGTDFSSSVNSSVLKVRDASVYSLSIDKTNTYNNENSLKIVGTSAGSTSSKDLAWTTQTNKSINEGYVGDNKIMTLSFYAKANVSGAKMYWRFGYSTRTYSVSLSTQWQKYSIKMTKENTDGNVLHPYFDKAGTFYINQVVLVDDSTAASVSRPESKTSALKDSTFTIGKTYSFLPTPTRSGYVFDGWYTQKVGGIKITTSTTVFENDINVFAHWTRIKNYQPSKISSYNGHYYSVFNDDVTWEEAETFCEKMGGHLVTISDSEENAFVQSLVSSQEKGLYWIGLTSKSGSWKWVNGESYNYKNWAPNQPSGGSEYYAEIYSRTFNDANAGTWNDLSGISPDISYYSVKNTGYICEFDPDEISVAKIGYYDGSLYKVFDSQISWENANSYAKNSGGHLVTIGSSGESSYINSLVKEGEMNSYWIGLEDRNATKNYQWVTGESLSYTNWSSGNPSYSSNIEHYVELSKDLNWNDVKNIGRDTYKTGFIVEYENKTVNLQSLSIVSKPTKLTYIQGESLDLTGLVVRANYDYNIREEVKDYTVSGYDKNTLGTQTITITYGGKTTKFNVEVLAETIPVTGIFLNKDEVKLTTNEKYELTATVTPSNASDTSFKWYSSNNSVVSVSDGMLTANAVGTAQITVKTNDGSFTDVCIVTVTAPKTLPKSLSLASKPSKLYYELGEEFDPTGMKVNVKYTDSSLKDVTDLCVVTGFDSSESSQQKVTLTYTENGVSVSVQFTVFIDRQVKNLYVTSKPEKTVYVMGEHFERNGMVVVATFTDGTSKEVTSAISTSGFDSTSSGVHQITVSYTYHDKTVSTYFSITMKPKLTGIVVTSKPTKIVYIMGEQFQKDGMVITAKFSDGTTRDVTSSCKTSGYDCMSPGVKTITATYSYATQTFSKTFSIVMMARLQSIAIESKPKKLSYDIGENFDSDGMIIKATFSDGSTKDITNKCSVSGFDSSSSGKKTITVSYKYGTVKLSKDFSVIIN